ncbi:hypothetical protein [Actinoplanes sp. NPDC049802]|uniref:hypothetical protein n=1 Tax=Actinoplanes sp. NPDC049802 TaxID=3154742 RepID=UPI0033CA385C
MPTERITLDLDATGLYAARYAAAARSQSLDEWISKVVRDHAIRDALEVDGPRDDLDEPPGWADEIMDNIFREDEE